MTDAFIAGALQSLVTPRPVVKVTTYDEHGVASKAPFSYINIVATKPPTLGIAVLREDGKMKQTARNALRTRRLIVETDKVRLDCGLTRAIDIGDSVLLLARVNGLEEKP